MNARRKWNRAWLALALLAFPFIAAVGSATPPVQGPRQSYAQGRIVIKFKASLSQSPAVLLGKGSSFQAALVDHSSSLDQLNSRYKAWHAHALFAQGSARSAATRKLSASATQQLDSLSQIHILAIDPAADAAEAARAYAADPHVEFAQPDYLIEENAIPTKPYYTTQGAWGQTYDDLWGLKATQAPQIWDQTQGLGVIVGVVDQGVDYNHPDLQGNMRVLPGSDFSVCLATVTCVPGDNPIDHGGHGTHVAGIIAATGANTPGVFGVAPAVTILPVKGLDDSGRGYISNLAQGIVFAAQNGAKVINNSWGCSFSCPSDPLAEQAVQTAMSIGAVVVFAAGNSAADVQYYSPQNMQDPKPVVVASTDHLDQKSDFSNFGDLVDVAAPGGESGSTSCSQSASILSLRAAGSDLYKSVCPGFMFVGTQYIRARGTSMAAPFVSGAAALLLSKYPNATPNQIRLLLKESADKIGAVGLGPAVGRMNVATAIGLPLPPGARITQPAALAAIDIHQPPVAITGTASDADTYSVYYATFPDNTQNAAVPVLAWNRIAGPLAAPASGTLASWSVASLPLDRYRLRLSVRNTAAGLTDDSTVDVALNDSTLPMQQLTTFSQLPSGLSAWGDRIAWRACTNEFLPKCTTNVYDTVSKSLVQPPFYPSGYLTNPAHLFGDRVVWVGDDPYISELFVFDMRNNSLQKIATSVYDNTEVAIDGDLVMWIPDMQRVMLYNLADGTQKTLSNTAGTFTSAPALSGRWAVWASLGFVDDAVVVHDLYTGQEKKILVPNLPNFVGVSGDRVIWTLPDPTTRIFQVFAYDLNTNTLTQITHSTGHNYNAVISGSRVVWQDGQARSFLRLYDLATHTEERLTGPVSHQYNPSLYGNTLVWADDRVDPNQSGLADALMTRPVGNDPLPTTVRIHAGGPTYQDSKGQIWNGDNGYFNGSFFQNSTLVTGTPDSALYQSMRWTNDTLHYRFKMAPGLYQVVLKFAEIQLTQTGQRVFDVRINGQTVQSGFDPAAAAGGPNKAVDLTFSVSASTGVVDISFVSVIGNPAVNAIQITKLETPPTVNPINSDVVDIDPTVGGIQTGEGTTIHFTATATDSDLDPLTWQWYYSIDGASPISAPGGSGAGANAALQFTTPVGSSGHTYTWTLSVNDGNSPPVTSPPYPIQIVNSVNLPAPVFNPPSDLTTQSTISVDYPDGYSIIRFDWTVGGQSTSSTGKSLDLTPLHLTPGAYPVNVKAVNILQNVSPAAQATVQLARVAVPTPLLSLPPFLSVGADISLGGADNSIINHYVWTFARQAGNGNPSSASAAPALGVGQSASFSTSGRTAHLSQQPLSPGFYLVTVVAMDANGNSSDPAQGQVTLVPADLSSVKAYPSPWRSDIHSSKPIIFDGLPANSTVKIFTVAGHWVVTLPHTNGQASWYLKNDDGDTVASGLYIYLVTDDQGNNARGKFAIIR